MKNKTGCVPPQPALMPFVGLLCSSPRDTGSQAYYFAQIRSRRTWAKLPSKKPLPVSYMKIPSFSTEKALRLERLEGCLKSPFSPKAFLYIYTIGHTSDFIPLLSKANHFSTNYAFAAHKRKACEKTKNHSVRIKKRAAAKCRSSHDFCPT